MFLNVEAMPASPVIQVRKICLALPEAHEVEAWGEPTFRAPKKMFAMFASAKTHHGRGRPAVWFKATREDQARMIGATPDCYFVPPYVGKSGWVGAWLDDVAADAAAANADRPVLVMGHHQNWMPNGAPNDDYFGIHPAGSLGLIEVMARHPGIAAYAAGHTHRHRVRRTEATGARPFIEVGTVKDFPGTWAEYRVHEGGIVQIVHRISDPAALAWSERCRHLFADYGFDYQTYAMGSIDDRCFVIPVR